MVSFTRGTKDFVVVSTKRQGFRAVATVAAVDVPEIAQILARIPRIGSVKPLELDISFGLNDDPVDERPEFFLSSVDLDNLPTVAAARDRAFWQAVENWRLVGTALDIGPIQTMGRDLADFFNATAVLFTEAAGYTNRQAIVILISSNVTSNMIVQGVLYYEEQVVQRRFGGDLWTWDTADEMHGGLTWEEYTDDEMESVDGMGG